jgi:hypothetical protein
MHENNLFWTFLNFGQKIKLAGNEFLPTRKQFWEAISADADGGPRSRVRTAGHSAQPPIDVSGNFSAHVSA